MIEFGRRNFVYAEKHSNCLVFSSRISQSLQTKANVLAHLYETNFHQTDISQTSFLITGGAGFIGSNIVEYLVHHGAGKIRILDDLSEGKSSNIEAFVNLEHVEFVEGDISDESTCRQVCEGVDYISHQAALGSVPRSIATPQILSLIHI